MLRGAVLLVLVLPVLLRLLLEVDVLLLEFGVLLLHLLCLLRGADALDVGI